MPTSRVGDIRGIVEPVRVVDVEITKDNDFIAWRLSSDRFDSFRKVAVLIILEQISREWMKEIIEYWV